MPRSRRPCAAASSGSTSRPSTSESSMFTPTTPSRARRAANAPTSSGSSLKPASRSTVTGMDAAVSRPRGRGSPPPSSPAPSGSPATTATPRLVVPSTGFPAAWSQRAEARSHAFGSTNGSPGRCMSRNSDAVSMRGSPRRSRRRWRERVHSPDRRAGPPRRRACAVDALVLRPGRRRRTGARRPLRRDRPGG